MGLCICINSIWWVMMKWVSTRRGFSEAEDQTVCAVWYLCVGPTVLPEIIGLLICPRVTVFLTDLLLEGTAEDEMKTLHLKINVYHQKHRSNLVIYFFPYGCMEKSDTSYIALRMYLWHTLIVNWIIQAEYLFSILWTTISKYWLFFIKMCDYCQFIPWKFQQHWARIAIWLFLSLIVFNFIVCMFILFLVMSLLTHQGWLFVKEKEMIRSSVYISHCIWWGLCRCL